MTIIAGGLPSRNVVKSESVPMFCGIPLKYISLVTLALQNALLAIIMHHSRVSTPPSKAYSSSSAVLLSEVLKGSISLVVAYTRVDEYDLDQPPEAPQRRSSFVGFGGILDRFKRLGRHILGPDCWKLSIPAILYVIQNNLQYVAASNLEAATFQVSYQLKILTTAACSVVLLRKQLSAKKWCSLLMLAVGVAIVQVQAGSSSGGGNSSNHDLNPFTGFVAVLAACVTSGLAGVYFEMVLKGSKTDLWVRNVQLSLFSLIPALLPFIVSSSTNADPSSAKGLFANFGFWAYATVIFQVLGGLITAVVIKYSDNILKGFATSLAIIISFLASVFLFNSHVTSSFLLGSGVVLGSTAMYNQPDTPFDGPTKAYPGLPFGIFRNISSALQGRKSLSSYPGSPIEPDSPIIGQFEQSGKKGFSVVNTGVLAAATLGLFTPSSSRAPSRASSSPSTSPTLSSSEEKNVLWERSDSLSGRR